MALISTSDIESQINADLTDPNGQALAQTLINAALQWAQSRCGYTFAKGSMTDLFDGGVSLFFLKTAAPVDTSVAATVEVYNPTLEEYEAYTGTVRLSSDGQVQLSTCPAEGFKAVKITYTAGWSQAEFPSDLKQALVELVARKFNAAQSGDQQLRRVTSGAYTEEYTTSNETALTDVPADIQEVVDRYRRVVVL